MSAAEESAAAKVGLEPEPLQRTAALLERWTREGRVPAAALCIGRRGHMVSPCYFGRQRPGPDAPPLRTDALFLVASLTKPVTALAVQLLVERGLLTLDDRVAEFVPAFGQNGKEAITLRHLLTHSSGLPDHPPNNDALRAGHQPLAAFITEVCRLAPDFEPGTAVRYASTGFAMLAEVVHQVSGVPLAEFLQRELFAPLGLKDTSLGWRPETAERLAEVRLTEEQSATDWHWNSPYWRGFGAPWGGLITSPKDYGRLLLMLLNGGALGKTRVLSPASVRAMTRNQLTAMPRIPEEERRCRPWGLGWRLHWPAHSANFGDLLGPRTFGHWGATGTLCWADPDAQAFCVLLTTQPQEPGGPYLARISNLIAAALV